MYGEVSALGVLDEPLVRRSIATEHQFHPGVLDNETHRAVAGVDRRNRTHHDAVLVIHDRILGFVIKLIHLDLAGHRRDLERARLIVPVVGLQETLNGVGGTHVLRLSTWTPDLQRHGPARGPAAGPE